MFFSIILPIYNVEAYLSRCIESIQMQECKDFEVIIIDDESTDNSLQIAKEASKKYGNIVIIEQPHAGQASGRNKGLKEAKGEYITFIDGDDYWESGYLENIKQVLSESKPDLCVGASFFLVRNGEKTRQTSLNCVGISECGTVDILFREEKIPGAMWLVICKRSIIEEQQITFSEELLCNEDFDFIMKMVVASKRVVVYSKPYYNYFRDNVTSTYAVISGQKIHSYMVAYRKWFDYFSEQDFSYSEKIRNAISHNYLWAYYQLIDLPIREISFIKDIKYLKETQYILKNTMGEKNIVWTVIYKKLHKKIHQLGHTVKKILITKERKQS